MEDILTSSTDLICPSDSYPYPIDNMLDSTHYITIETDYRLIVGVRKNDNGENEIYATMKNGIGNETIPNGDKADIKTYKRGGLPSAGWTININAYTTGETGSKNIYLFLSKTRSYLHDSATLPEDIELTFDDVDVDVSADLFQNEDKIYNMIMESGALFDRMKTYRKFAVVRSALNGELYRRSNTSTLVGSITNIDPSLDTKFKQWEPVVSQIEIEKDLLSKYVTIDQNVDISGIKTFLTPPMKSSESINPQSFELICRQEGERLFLKKDEMSTSANYLRNYPPSPVGGINAINSESKNGSLIEGLVVVTDKNGKIDQSFLDAQIINSESILTVDKANYNNRTSFASIQDAYDAALKMIRLSPILIRIKDGEYTVDGNNKSILTADKILDAGMISIIGNESRPENVKLKIKSANNGIVYSGKGLFMNGFTIEQMETDKGESTGIKVDYGSTLMLGSAINITNCLTGVSASNCSVIDGSNIYISDCDIAIGAKSSVVNLESSRVVSCRVGVVALYNSTVNIKGSQFKKGDINTGKTIGIISEYNSVVNAESTNISSDIDNMYNNHESSVPNETGGIIIIEEKYQI